MRGRVVDYNFQTGAGVISGSDGGRYTFYRAEWRKPEEPARGTVVDFVVSDGIAKSVYPLQGADATLPGRPVPPRPNAGQAQGQSNTRQQAGTGPTRGAYAGAAPQQGSGTGMREVGFAVGFAAIGAVLGILLGLFLALSVVLVMDANHASESYLVPTFVLTWIGVTALCIGLGVVFGVKRAGRSNTSDTRRQV